MGFVVWDFKIIFYGILIGGVYQLEITQSLRKRLQRAPYYCGTCFNKSC